MNEPTLEAPGAEYYRQNYPDYEAQNPDRKLRHYLATIERFLLPGCPRRLHDLGCAFGKFLATLPTGWEAFGSDTNAYALESARRNVPTARFALSLPDQASPFRRPFGVVTAFDVLEHLEKLPAVAKEIHRQLVPGGLFVFVVPVYDGVTGPVVHWLDRDPTHVHKRHRDFWLSWAATHFKLVHWEGVFRYLLPKGPYVHLPTRALRRHSPAILVAARRS